MKGIFLPLDIVSLFRFVEMLLCLKKNTNKKLNDHKSDRNDTQQLDINEWNNLLDIFSNFAVSWGQVTRKCVIENYQNRSI